MQIHRYSYGQPVRGSMKANIKVKSSARFYHRRYSHSGETISDVEIDREGALNGETGCHTLKLSGDQLGITNYRSHVQKTLQVGSIFTSSKISLL